MIDAPKKSGFEVIAVDWSGASRESDAKKFIWRAVSNTRGSLTELSDGINREKIKNYLIERALQKPEIVVGLDFAFSMPRWFVQEQKCSSATEFWSCVKEYGEGWLAACRPPFWGRRGCPRPDGHEHFDRPRKT